MKNEAVRNRLIGRYINGNVAVKIFSDGTKVRMTNDDEFKVEFAENSDIKITNYCEEGCAYCHEMSNKQGQHGDLESPFFNTIHPFTEIAIGGGNPLQHPQILPFLKRMKERKVISSMTVNQKTLRRRDQFLLLDKIIQKNLIFGIGISVEKVDEHLKMLADMSDNVVVHIIAGITPIEEIRKLYAPNRKVLFLGYKHNTGRGVSFFESHQQEVTDRINEVKDNLKEIVENFKVVSFDNRAIDQLEVKNHLTEQEWDEFFLGTDGKQSMYIDVVKQEFARSSTSTERFKLEDTMQKMFNKVRV